MDLKVDAPESAARLAAATIAADTWTAIAWFAQAVRGGYTPWIMLGMLGNEDIPWAGVHVYQADERVAPNGHPDTLRPSWEGWTADTLCY